MMIISFLLEGILSNYVIYPFFLTLTSVVLSSIYLKEDSFIKYSLIIGILYDIVYTNTLFVNGILFFLISLCILDINERYKNTLLYLVILNILIHFIYVIVTYFLLVLFRYLTLDFLYLFSTFIKSIIIDTIYFFIIYFILHKIKHHT